jgi:hypothetical protein
MACLVLPSASYIRYNRFSCPSEGLRVLFQAMDIREARDQAVLFGMDVFEGVTGTGLAIGAFLSSYCIYEGVAELFQDDGPWESTPFTILPGALIYSSVMYGMMRVTQTSREVLYEHRAKRQ